MEPHSSTSQSASTGAAAASAISSHLDTRTAATEAAGHVFDAMAGACDLAFVFASYHHLAAFVEAAEIVRTTLNPGTMLGATAESVLGDDEEIEGRSGFTVLGLRLPNATLHPWTSTPEDPIRISQPQTIAEHVGLRDDHRGVIVLADPFSTPLRRLLPAMSSTTIDGRTPKIAGGVASGSTQPGRNVLICNDLALRAGAVGVTIGGGIELDFVVSQGCKPIGKPAVITKAQSNIVLELGGKKAFEFVQEVAQSLNEHDRSLLGGGLLIGRVIDERKERFGRGDFLIRNVLGFDKRVNGIVIGEEAKLGRTVQFHVRDAQTATEDLQLLLDAQQLKTPPFGALLFTCNGRGERLFGEANHDLNLVRDRLNHVPTAGFFAAGEIGPVGEGSFVHGQTVSLVLFRERR